MKNISKEKLSFAVPRLKQAMESRGVSQSHLAALSGVGQSTISKVISGQMAPNHRLLRKLFGGLGLRLDDILEEPDDRSADRVMGYLATPLTEIVDDPKMEDVLHEVVSKIKRLLQEEEFQHPHFEIYWPGDHTHPRKHAAFRPNEVYLIDRSRVSSFDFLILFCGTRSFGVGQENEIATQAGLPAIRLIPDNPSRMLTGSFLNAVDIPFAGTLTTAINFDEELFRDALRKVRQLHFQHQAFYLNLNGAGLGERLRELIKDRMSDYEAFADELGVRLSYVHTLMNEPLTVSNPSTRLLQRMARRLGVTVGYLLHDSPEFDIVSVESNATWRQWIGNKDQVNGSVALEILDSWKDEYNRAKSEATLASYRKELRPVTEADWERRYQKQITKLGQNAKLF